MEWKLEHIIAVWEKMKSEKITGTDYRKLYSPYRFLRAIGWDKVEYDNFCIKLKAHSLKDNELTVFQYIYDRVQDILADLMDFSIIQPKIASSCRLMFDIFQPSFGREKKASQFYSNIQRANDITNSINSSPIKITNNENK